MNNYRAKLLDLLGSIIIATMLAASLTLSLVDSMALPHSAPQIIVVCLALSLLLSLFSFRRATALIALLILGVAGFAAYRSGTIASEIGDLVYTITSLGRGGEGSIQQHAQIIAFMIAAVLTLLSYSLSRMNGGVFPALTIAALVIFGGWLFEKRLTAMYLLPAFVALAIMFAKTRPGQSLPWARAIPAALLAAAIAYVALPAGQVTWPPLEQAAEQVRQLFDDYFMFTSPRTAYSISSDGYQPEGERLGGPATPREGEVMSVTTDRLLYLRGTIKRTYTGSSWVDTSINNRYLFSDPRNSALRNNIFNVDLSDAQNPAFSNMRVDVTMLNPGTSTLFLPGRTTALDINFTTPAYHNDNGEVFLTRSVVAGDAYSFSALVENSAALPGYVESASARADSGYARAREQYMALPAGVEDGVYWLTQSIIEGVNTPYEKAVAIRDYLSHTYSYTLDVGYPPRNRDFVSYFLLTSGEGYCSYFASSLAVMARMAGIPSRYVEGYLVKPEEGGVSTVTGQDAHAWVELYLNGVGWVTFDATPTDTGDNQGQGQGQEPPPPGETDPPPPEEEEEEDPTPEPDDPDDQPEEEEPTPTPEPEEEDPTPEPDEEHPTPEPTDDTSDGPDDTSVDQQDPDDDRRDWLWILFAVLLLAAIAAILAYRINISNPANLEKKYRDGDTRLMVWYRAVLGVLLAGGHSPAPGETPVAFASRLIKDSGAPGELLEFARAVSFNRYAGRRAEEPAFDLASRTYALLAAGLTLKQKIKWYRARITKGIGDINHIP